MKYTRVLFLLLLNLKSFSQQDSLSILRNKLLTEGIDLYNSQAACWNAADLLLQKENGKNIAGYFSYKQDSVIKTVFYTDKEKVIATYTFKPPVSVESYSVDLKSRKLTEYESALAKVRHAAFELLNYDFKFFKRPENSSFYVIMLDKGEEVHVFIIVGPKVKGAILLGNDYLMRYKKSDASLIDKKVLNPDVINLKTIKETHYNYVTYTQENPALPYISSTNICSLLLYSLQTEWSTYKVESKTHLSVFNAKTKLLTITPLPKK